MTVGGMEAPRMNAAATCASEGSEGQSQKEGDRKGTSGIAEGSTWIFVQRATEFLVIRHC